VRCTAKKKRLLSSLEEDQPIGMVRDHNHEPMPVGCGFVDEFERTGGETVFGETDNVWPRKRRRVRFGECALDQAFELLCGEWGALRVGRERGQEPSKAASHQGPAVGAKRRNDHTRSPQRSINGA